MIVLKEVKRFIDTNSVEVTWVDGETVVRCHSYADVQMDMLRDDLGADAPAYADLIALVEANIQPPAPVNEASEMARYLSEFKSLRLLALGRLDGRQATALTQGRQSDAMAIEVAKQGLRDMTAYPTVVAATTGDAMRIALKNRYYDISAALYASSPGEFVAFKALDL